MLDNGFDGEGAGEEACRRLAIAFLQRVADAMGSPCAITGATE
jgi:hypothetical protein